MRVSESESESGGLEFRVTRELEVEFEVYEGEVFSYLSLALSLSLLPIAMVEASLFACLQLTLASLTLRTAKIWLELFACAKGCINEIAFQLHITSSSKRRSS